MKKTFFYLFILTAFNVWSQTKHFDIKWQLNSIQNNRSVKPDELVLFQSENYQYKPGNVIFSQVWQSPSMIDPKSVKLINIKSSPIDASIVKKLKLKNLTDVFQPKLNTAYARNDVFATFEINTIIQKNGQYYKLDTFDVQYAYSSIKRRPHSQNIYDSRWASGKWYKFKIDKSGVYKLSKSFLKSLGLDVNNLDPRKLKIFGNGGKVMPLKNSTPYPEDISELAIEVVGGQDGSFDNDDYVLFYAQSDKEWSTEYDSNLNIYTNDTYYFVQIDDVDGKRIQPYQEPAGAPIETFDQYRARKFYEKDKTIFTYIGRKVFDEPLDLHDNNTKTIQFDFDHRDTSKPVYYKVKAATNKGNTSFRVTINDQDVGRANFSTIGLYSLGIANSISGNMTISNDPINITVSYNNNGFFDAHLYLEYINVKAYCYLTQSGKQFRFHHPDADTGNGIAAYHFNNAADITRIWDITDIYNPTYINNSQTNFDIKFLKQDQKRFIAIDKNDYYTPEKVDNSLQSNQNLHHDLFYHTGHFQDLDYIIVTPSFLYDEAEKFADMHRQRGMNVYVAKLQQIYNEFGNSQQDIAAIRNMVKYVYNNASAPDKKLQFLMLFGDASNDFKNVIPENLLSNGKNSNIVPIFESINSFGLVSSVASDDFYAMMDDNEGSLSGYEKPDIAVGRLLVRNTHEAEVMYRKYQHYLSEQTKRNWRTFITLWADDADPGLPGEKVFVTNTEAIAQKLKQKHPEFNVIKIYQDAYLQVDTPGGPRYPDAKRDLFNRFETGTLILAYIGHGNPSTLSHERMLTLDDVGKLHNFDRLPLMTTMTCEFARFDNATRESTAEHLLWNSKGGVLEMVSTSREISFPNATNMNTDFYDALFGMKNGMTGQIIRNPAKALQVAKINTSREGKFNIVFLGDPGFELGFAKPKIVLNSINNKPTDTLKALRHMIVKGEIQDGSGNLMSGFNGIINPIVFDKYQTDEVLDNDHNDYTLQFEKLGKKLFQGKADVVNGQFTFEFVVPKDIDLAYGKGRLSFYAVNDTEEKIGYDESIVVGGVDENATEDNKPPVIKAYMNDRNFVSGGITDANPYLLLDLSDENGINTIGGIGHDITAYLDDNQTEVYVLNDFYETENNTYQRGNVRYRLFDLKPGWHTLHIKAWDVYNNSGTTEINFQVVENTAIKLEHVLNYPNPFTDYTEFWFNHNHPFENLDVMVQVYTISGKLVWQHRQSVISDGFLSRDITWDGRDNFGNKLAKGVYVYKLSVKTVSGKTAQKIEKLVIL